MCLHANTMLEEERAKPLNDPRSLSQHSRVVECVPPEQRSVAVRNMDGEDLIAANKVGKPVGIDAVSLRAGSSKTSSPPVANDDLAEACLKCVANPIASGPDSQMIRARPRMPRNDCRSAVRLVGTTTRFVMAPRPFRSRRPSCPNERPFRRTT
jgi:hypothetical protein